MTGAWRSVLGRHADIAIVVAVIGVLLILFVPVPRALLDFLILANFGLALLILLLAFYVTRPVDFSTFPSVLLIATLFRLALNVAATRLILSDGDAGRVIAAVGSYVVAGNFVVGFTVFCILVVVQFVVVTSGAQRVSEVAARFTLDSLPGQQMSIDADLNMGFIDQAEAQRRRRQLEREAHFHGAMDGASKFVKGDAVAGILVLLIDIVGGLLIGVLQHRMPWAQALQAYTLLTVGDGLVTQVPALVIAVATGLLVTRSASDGKLSARVVRQLTSEPKTLWVVCAALSLLVLLPGIPVLPALVLAGVAGAAATMARRFRDPDATVDKKLPPPASAQAEEHAAVEPLEVLVGARWSEAVAAPDGPIVPRIAALRRQFSEELGIALPAVRFRTATRLEADAYEIHIDAGLAARARRGRTGCWPSILPGTRGRCPAKSPASPPTACLPSGSPRPTGRRPCRLASPRSTPPRCS